MAASSRTIFKGPIASKTKETDGEIFIPGLQFSFDVGTWTATRIAAGNWVMRKTAAANTSNPSINLADYFNKKVGADPNWDVLFSAAPSVVPADIAHDVRGFEITAIDVVYGIATAALNAHTYDLVKATYANNVAVATDATIGGTLSGALATATQANPYLTTVTLGTPYILGENLTRVAAMFELTVNAAATSVYDLYGVFVRYNYNLN